MIRNEFLLIDKSVLPKFFSQVVEASRLVEQENKSVSDSCKQMGISRSTFYKYKDKVFPLSSSFGRKAIISFRTEHERGILSNILNTIAGYKGNILTINQDMPIHNLAYITVTLDSEELSVSIYELISNLKKIPKVRDVSLLAFE